MKVIFKRDLQNIARKNQIKTVSSGFALNFLIPNGYAVMATPEAEKQHALIMKAAEAEKKVQHALFEKNMAAISEAKLKISAKANEKGHLFSGIHTAEIVAALKSQAHLDVSADMVLLDKPLKETGTHKVKIGTEDKIAMLSVEIVAA